MHAFMIKKGGIQILLKVTSNVLRKEFMACKHTFLSISQYVLCMMDKGCLRYFLKIAQDCGQSVWWITTRQKNFINPYLSFPLAHIGTTNNLRNKSN